MTSPATDRTWSHLQEPDGAQPEEWKPTPSMTIETDEEAVGIMKIKVSEIHPRVLTAGDPHRVKYIASLLDEHHVVADNREYYTVSGLYKGVPVTVSSHGVGGGGASMQFHELIDAGAKVIIRAGTCGSFQPHLTEGSLVVVSGAIRRDGVTDMMVPLNYPAVASHDVVAALSKACDEFTGEKMPYDVGFCCTEGVFYDGPLGNKNEFWQKCGVKAVEMEASVLFVMSTLRNVKTGCILNVDNYIFKRLDPTNTEGYKPHRQIVAEGTKKMCSIALDALIAVKL